MSLAATAEKPGNPPFRSLPWRQQRKRRGAVSALHNGKKTLFRRAPPPTLTASRANGNPQ
ncbi:hypothetical protein [Mesorhizobium sp.]|uniref:hypothetical protein n=1 Tax=Mesorhizobium sp. TaxID=1871066 RepID=UPI000FE755C6|nr:hypothetical protein [Mesorhizobium sp.]RWG00254.1 MAG: hypothetical protein EOQ54_27025 [Mesorhizobium sp.]RWG96726.1 MAG: hypothetical protein EOQ72_20915 [Mesorhizobium sp.]TIN39892.1 MAG: hypothetical protein E5Y25_20250 [Mesorhizobium sp.]TIQ93235.1 MAG: hypothetical protein E5X36_31015 [Mesorhizobium sp.]TIR94562.1 MAG: hypothetical protein E5X08_05225 [Mesorhizobium sp.]